MVTFFGYVFLGLSLAAPIGPLNAAQLDKGIKSGFIHAWLVGIGSIIADIIFMLTVYFGVIHFLEVPMVQAFLWSFGFFVLIYTGVEGLKGAGKIETRSSDKRESAGRSFFSGFLISISNPLSILFWLGIYGSILAQTTTKYSTNYVILYSCAIFLGLFIWDLTMAGVASSFRRFLSGNGLKYISVFSGLSLIGFGIYFGIQAIRVLFF